MIKSVLLIFVLNLGAFNAYTQLYVNGRNLNDSLNLKIIELFAIDNTVYGRASKDKFYSIEYGQAREQGNRQLTDSTGKNILLKSILGAANYIAMNGWKLFDVNYYVFEEVPYYKYTFVRIEE